MAEPLARGITGLVPMVHVADVQSTVDLYKLMGLEVRGIVRNSAGDLQWVYMACERAEVMFTRADEPVIASKQAVLFYLYSPDLIPLREHLLASGVKVSAIRYPEYMPKGEIRVDDPDGYCLLMGQAG